jgi:ATP phosphoribosyltransferase
MSYGATEVKVPRLADYLVDVTETGSTLKRNGKKILETLLVSSTMLIANRKSYENPEKRRAIDEIAALLMGVVDARDRALLTIKAEACNLGRVLNFLEVASLDSPVVVKVFSEKPQPEWFQVETIVRKSELNVTIPEIRKLGAERIVEVDITKMIL